MERDTERKIRHWWYHVCLLDLAVPEDFLCWSQLWGGSSHLQPHVSVFLGDAHSFLHDYIYPNFWCEIVLLLHEMVVKEMIVLLVLNVYPFFVKMKGLQSHMFLIIWWDEAVKSKNLVNAGWGKNNHVNILFLRLQNQQTSKKIFLQCKESTSSSKAGFDVGEKI